MKKKLGTVVVAAATLMAVPQMASADNGAYPADPPEQASSGQQPAVVAGASPARAADPAVTELPATGGQSSYELQIGLAAVATGTALLVAARRRRSHVTV